MSVDVGANGNRRVVAIVAAVCPMDRLRRSSAHQHLRDL